MNSRQLKYLDLIVKNNRVPHAFLFYGRSAGYVKKTAQSFFVRLNGAEFSDQIIKELHPDVLFIKPPPNKKEHTIAQIRALREFVSRTSFGLKKKGVFIEQAERLNEESWNALLKTLEEPAGDAVLFILSSGLKNIPKTILSRVVSLVLSDSAENAPKRFSSKDDIIVEKLEKLESLGDLEKFDLAEQMVYSENLAEVLDSWLLSLRIQMLSGGLSASKTKLIEAVADAKNKVVSTDASARLVLENLMLNI